MNLTPIIGDRINLVPFEESHISDTYLSWLNDRSLMRYSRQKHLTHTSESSLAYLASYSGTPHQFWAIIKQDTQHHIGTMNAYFDIHHATADLGLLIGESKVHGQGFGLEAWKTGMQFLFDEHNVRKITGGTNSQNKGMVKIMEQAEMTLEGTKKDQEIIDNELTDIVLYAKFNLNCPPLEADLNTTPSQQS
jgi:RimJ/RimL family protein N-acetyltransferase